MNYRRAGYAIVFVILLCALANWNSEEKLQRVQLWFSDRPPPRNMAKQAWNHCRKELVDKDEATEDVYFYMTKEAFKSILLKKSVLKAFEILPPQMKQTILDCLSKDRLSSTNWLIRCLELLFDCPDIPRRHLGTDSDNPKPILIQPTLGFKVPSQRPSITVNHEQKKSGGNSIQILIVIGAAAVVVIVSVSVFLFCCISRVEEGSGSLVGGKEVAEKQDEKSSPALSRITASLSDQNLSLGDNALKELNLDDGKALSSKNNEFGMVMSSEKYESGSYRHSSVTGTPLPESTPPLKPPTGRPVVATGTAEEVPPPLPPPTPPRATAPLAPPPPRPPGSAPPPPPPIGGRAPPPPPPRGGRAPPPAAPRKGAGPGPGDPDDGAHKTKLKPFFWDKVNANPNQSMVWDEISAGSFQFNEEMMESLFGYANTNQDKPQKKVQAQEPSVQKIQIIDKKKAQNLSILLKALGITTKEVCDALTEGNELPVELVSTLLKMAPTQEEELKLRLYDGDVALLGPAEQFLKSLVVIPLAYKRLECLLFKSNLQEETTGIKKALATLEVASTELKNSRLFLKLLEAVLKTGNRMNDGTYRGGAMAFKLDTLLKLSDVKGTDGKTTLLHFVVLEIIRFEGKRVVGQEKPEDLDEKSGADIAEHHRILGLGVVSGLSAELEDVKQAATIDASSLASTLSQLGQSLVKSKAFMKCEDENMGEESETDKFHVRLARFVEHADVEIKGLLEEEKRIMALVKSTGDYFHGSSGKDEGLRLFVIVRDFLKMLDKVCYQIKEQQKAAMVKACKQQESDRGRSLFPEMRDGHTEEKSSSDGSKDANSKKDSLSTASQILQQMLDRNHQLTDDESSSDDDDESDSEASPHRSASHHGESSSDEEEDETDDSRATKDSLAKPSSSRMDGESSSDDDEDDESEVSSSEGDSSSASDDESSSDGNEGDSRSKKGSSSAYGKEDEPVDSMSKKDSSSTSSNEDEADEKDSSGNEDEPDNSRSKKDSSSMSSNKDEAEEKDSSSASSNQEEPDDSRSKDSSSMSGNDDQADEKEDSSSASGNPKEPNDSRSKDSSSMSGNEDEDEERDSSSASDNQEEPDDSRSKKVSSSMSDKEGEADEKDSSSAFGNLDEPDNSRSQKDSSSMSGNEDEVDEKDSSSVFGNQDEPDASRSNKDSSSESENEDEPYVSRSKNDSSSVFGNDDEHDDSRPKKDSSSASDNEDESDDSRSKKGSSPTSDKEDEPDDSRSKKGSSSPSDNEDEPDDSRLKIDSSSASSNEDEPDVARSNKDSSSESTSSQMQQQSQDDHKGLSLQLTDKRIDDESSSDGNEDEPDDSKKDSSSASTSSQTHQQPPEEESSSDNSRDELIVPRSKKDSSPSSTSSQMLQHQSLDRHGGIFTGQEDESRSYEKE